MSDVILYGIRTCDTCKRAEKELISAGHKVRFRDVRAEPLEADELQELLIEFGERLVNRSSTTYRGMSDWLKASEAEDQLAAHPTVMKRPVLSVEGKLYLGWSADVQAALIP